MAVPHIDQAVPKREFNKPIDTQMIAKHIRINVNGCADVEMPKSKDADVDEKAHWKQQPLPPRDALVAKQAYRTLLRDRVNQLGGAAIFLVAFSGQ